MWNGLNLDIWAQHQTLHPVNARPVLYSGLDPLWIGAYDWMERIPLDVRLANFKERLARALSRQ